MGHRVSKGAPPRQQECLWKSLVPARRTRKYAREAARGFKRLLIPSCFTGQKRSSCKSRGPTDNVQKKGPEARKASLRQRTYPEIVPEDQSNLGSSTSQSSKDGQDNLGGTDSRRSQRNRQSTDKGQALLAARLRRSRRAAGAAHRAGGRRRSSGLCFGKKTTSQHNLKTHRQRAAQDSPTPAAQVLPRPAAPHHLDGSSIIDNTSSPTSPAASPSPACPLPGHLNNGGHLAQQDVPVGAPVLQAIPAAAQDIYTSSQESPIEEPLSRAQQDLGCDCGHQQLAWAQGGLPDDTSHSPLPAAVFDDMQPSDDIDAPPPSTPSPLQSATTNGVNCSASDWCAWDGTSQSAATNGVNCEVPSQAHHSDAPLVGQEAAITAIQDGSASEAAPSQDTISSGEKGTGILPVEAAHQANPNPPSIPTVTPTMLQIASHGADSATSAPHQALPDEVSTSQAAAAAAQNSNGLFEVHSVEALQAIVDTSSPKCISPAVANAIEAMQPGSGPDAQHWAADLHSTGHSGQKKPPRLTAPDNESTSSLSHQNLPVLRLARGISLPADPEAFLLGGTPGVAQHASFGEEALRQRHARLHAALDSTFGSLARREAMRKAFGALKANAAIMRLAKDNSERREIFAQLYSRFNETKCAARGFCSQAQDLQSELDELRSQNAFLVEKMAPLKSLVTHYKDLNSQLQARLTDTEDREKAALTERNQLQSQLQQTQDILKDVPTHKQALESLYGPMIWGLEQEVWRLTDEALNHKANREWVLHREKLETKYTQLQETLHPLVLRIVYLEQENMRLRVQTGETELSAPVQAYLMPAEWSAPYPRSWSTAQQNMWLKAGLKAMMALAEQGGLLTEEALLQGQRAAFKQLNEEAAQTAIQQGAALPKTLAQLVEEHCEQHEAGLLAAAAERDRQSAAEHDKQSALEQTAALCEQMVAQLLSLGGPPAQQALVLASAAQREVQSAAQHGLDSLLMPAEVAGNTTSPHAEAQSAKASATLSPGAFQLMESPPSEFTTSVALTAGSTVSTIVFSSSAASSSSSTKASSGYQSMPQSSAAQLAVLHADSGRLPADYNNRSMPPSATNGSPPAPESTPVAKEGAQINQGELLPETCPAEARVDLPPVFDTAAFLLPEEMSLFGALEDTQAQTDGALFGQGGARRPLDGDLADPDNPFLQQW